MTESNNNIVIDLGERSYPIIIGQGITCDKTLDKKIEQRNVLVVSNETIAPLYLEQVVNGLGNRLVETVILPDGEAYKNLDVLNRIFDGMLEAGFGRDCCVVALGGGVVGDMAGFAAAAYQRGVALVQLPTSLLAQVDSSVGGKTGVNHALGKNMIGAFHQPEAVLIDTDVLSTLPQRELSAGLAEVIKYGFIHDAEFFAWLEQHIDDLLGRDADALAFAIRRSCEIKAEIVAADEREHGVRALLNFGHTFGHAIENLQGYGNWLHGEAVGAGMCMALDMSKRMGKIDKAASERGISLIERAQLPTRPPANLTAAEIIKVMGRDKKVMDGQVRLILLENIGSAIITAEFEQQLLETTINAALDT